MTRFGCAGQDQSCAQTSLTDDIATTLIVVDGGLGTPSTEGGNAVDGSEGSGQFKRTSYPTSPKFLDFGHIFLGSGMTSYGGGG
jgi:hypothetical protein